MVAVSTPSRARPACRLDCLNGLVVSVPLTQASLSLSVSSLCSDGEPMMSEPCEGQFSSQQMWLTTGFCTGYDVST